LSIRDFLYYSKSDRRSIVVLSLIAVVLVGVLVVKNAGGSAPSADAADTAVVATVSDTAIAREPVEMHEFDPNTVDSATLIGFGLTPRQVQGFLNYRRAGAVFRTPQSVARVYSLPDESIGRLLPYIVIGEEYAERKRYNAAGRSERELSARHEGKGVAADSVPARKSIYPEKFKTLTKVDPNTADTALLQRIPGVGSWISRNIVEQRERLGGYHSAEQLLEVKFFSPELLEWFEVDASAVSIKQLDVNTASFQRLNSHPYITYEQTRDLLRYIRLYGRVDSIDALRRTGIFTEEELARLAPYLSF
jgi:DNA uptake protein ComE-like DNA-binding protein